MRGISNLCTLAAVTVALWLSGCAAPAATPGAANPDLARSAPSAVGAADPAPPVQALLDAAQERPFSLTLQQDGELLLDMGARPNGDCYVFQERSPAGVPMDPEPPYDFVRVGLQVWGMHYDGDGDPFHGPYWDAAVPGMPFVGGLIHACPDGLAAWDLLRRLTALEVAEDAGGAGATWTARPAEGQHLSFLPLDDRPVTLLELQFEPVDGLLLPAAYRIEAGSGPSSTVFTAAFTWGEAYFPADIPVEPGLGLFGVALGSSRDDIPDLEAFTTRDEDGGGLRLVDAAGGREIRLDARGRVTGLRRTGGRLINGLTLGGSRAADVQRRFGAPSEIQGDAWRYLLPGGETLVFLLDGGVVTSVEAFSP